MDNLYTYIESRAKAAGYKNMTEFCKAAKIPRATMSELKAGRTKSLSGKTAASVSNSLDIPINVLWGTPYDSPIVYCEDCGLEYDASDAASSIEHRKHHSDWAAANCKFGFCWNDRVREERKQDARAVVSNTSLPLSERVDAQIIVFKSFFSRSLAASGFDLDHVDFQTFVSMLLNQGDGACGATGAVYDELVAKFGKTSGIPRGTYYHPETKKDTAPQGGVDKELFEIWETADEDERRDLLEMARMLKARRKK